MRRKLDKLKFSLLILLTAVSVFFCAHGYAFNQCDFNKNGLVNLDDFSVLTRSWGKCFKWGPGGLPNQMISLWRLDQNATDSQSGFDGIVHGDPDWVTGLLKQVGSGAIFMDGEDYIEINASEYPEMTGSFAVDVWVKTDASEFEQVVISKGKSSWQLGIEATTGKAFFSCNGLSPTSYLQSTTVITNNAWHRISAVYDQSEQKILLYIDGLLDAQANTSGVIDSNFSNIWIGGDPEQTTTASWFYGYIDNVRIFNHAAGPDEIFKSNAIHVDINSSSGKKNGYKRQSAYSKIQDAIDIAEDGDEIHVWPGVYTESIDFLGKAIIIRSVADAAVIRSPDDYAVTFYSGEDANSILENFIIKESEVAISVSHSSPTLRNLTIVSNFEGINLWGSSLPAISNCILWHNEEGNIFTEVFPANITYSCIERPAAGEGNISAEPLFVNTTAGDYHLKSRIGRYLPDNSKPQPRHPKQENWIIDKADSPCIDAGKPEANPMNETMPNGGRINIGAYGSTAFASKSPWPLEADINHNGHVWHNDLMIFIQNWMQTETE